MFAGCGGSDDAHPLEDVEGCRYRAAPEEWECDEDAETRGLDLTGADLTDANLTGADLTNANLTGADLTGANLTNADFCNTTMPDGSVDNSGC